MIQRKQAEVRMFGNRKIISLLTQLLEETKKMSTTVPAGLQALETQEAALATAVTNLVSVIQSAATAIQNAVNEADEDATVASIATQIGQQVGNITAAANDLQTAVTPPASTPAPTGTAPAEPASGGTTTTEPPPAA